MTDGGACGIADFAMLHEVLFNKDSVCGPLPFEEIHGWFTSDLHDATVNGPLLPASLDQPTLFLVVLGGRTDRSLIELHDVRFVAGRCIEDTYPELRRQWFGRRRGLHLDSYMAVHCIDGWRVTLELEPDSDNQRLWFVNLGGYQPDSLAELHRFGLVVAPSLQAAKAAAKQRWLLDALQQHKDDLSAVDDCLAIEQLSLTASKHVYVHLHRQPDCASQNQVPDWFGYRPI